MSQSNITHFVIPITVIQHQGNVSLGNTCGSLLLMAKFASNNWYLADVAKIGNYTLPFTQVILEYVSVSGPERYNFNIYLTANNLIAMRYQIVIPYMAMTTSLTDMAITVAGISVPSLVDGDNVKIITLS